MKIEIIVTNLEEALLAEQYGADRLELIHDFKLGGLSPVLDLSKEICTAVKIPISIMVRPHGESFVYEQNSIKQIMREIDYLRDETKAHGIVFGALTPEGNLDTHLLQQIIDNKGQLALTFHRAIDAANDTLACYKALLNYPAVNLVLTSGGKPTALEGVSIIKEMVDLSKPYSHAKILAGSAINMSNAQKIIELTGVTEIHIGSGVRTNGVLDPLKFKHS
jgi:copper homeostasis protein